MMNSEQRKQVIDAMNKTARDMEHLAFKDGYDRIVVENMRESVLNGLKLIYEQDSVIQSLIGNLDNECESCRL